jgi:hypothetical protein
MARIFFFNVLAFYVALARRAFCKETKPLR